VLVPTWTDSEAALRQLGEFIATLKTVEVVEILPFHQMGAHKWDALGCQYALRNVPSPTKSQGSRAIEIIQHYHPNVR
jgi:pyruvate formate lyase activating enzyme